MIHRNQRAKRFIKGQYFNNKQQNKALDDLLLLKFELKESLGLDSYLRVQQCAS